MDQSKLYILYLEGYSYRLLKTLAAYDTEMPVLMADKLSGSFVRSDVVATPAVRKYVISRLEAVDTSKLFRIEQKSVQKCLIFLYNIDKE